MNRYFLPLLFVACQMVSPVQACLNDYVPNVVALQRSMSLKERLTRHQLKEPWAVRRDRLRQELANGGDYRVKNDLANALAHTGAAAEAVTLLEEIEAEKPGLYATAANLGTAYELAGDDRKALEWIRKGIERSPDSHEGTEWLHVRILEAKLAMNDDPSWLENRSIALFSPGAAAAENPPTGNRGEKLSPEQIKAALIYQLHERIQFVRPPDAIVGVLLMELGSLVAEEPSGLGGATDVYVLSMRYLNGLPSAAGLQGDAEMLARFAEDRGLRTYFAPRSHVADFVGLASAGLLLGIVVVAVKRMIQRNSAG